MDIIYVTNNDLKFESAKNTLNCNLIQEKINISEIQSDDPYEIAVSKAKLAYEKVQKPLIINDCSFIIPSLNNFPGGYASFVEKTIGDEGILALMENKEDRSCYYLDILVYIDNDEIKVFTDKTSGTIATHSVEGNYYPYDKIFIKKGSNGPICFENENAYLNKTYELLNNYLKKRRTSRGIVFFDDQVLLIYRKRKENNKILEYYAIPGGGIESDETKEIACVRELQEETSLNVSINTYLGYDEYETGICYYYLTNYLSGDIKLGGEELENNNLDNYYELQLIKIADLDNIFINGVGSEMIKKAYQISKGTK